MIEFLRVIGILMAVGAVLGLVGLALIYRRLKRLNIPPEASFRETLQRVPLSVVVVLDLLDLGFDVLATPLVWLVLGRFNLRALRRVSTIEAFIPGTQMIPTLTVCWFAVRFFDPQLRTLNVPGEDTTP